MRDYTGTCSGSGPGGEANSSNEHHILQHGFDDIRSVVPDAEKAERRTSRSRAAEIHILSKVQAQCDEF